MTVRAEPGAAVRRAASAADLAAARRIRYEVFVLEQGLPAAHESDGQDADAVHAIAVIGEEAVGVGRLIRKSPQTGVIGRIAVLPAHRNRGIAAQLMHALEAIARERGLRHIEIIPHDFLEGFYTRLGYQTVPGGEFMIESHRVLTMEKNLDRGT